MPPSQEISLERDKGIHPGYLGHKIFQESYSLSSLEISSQWLHLRLGWSIFRWLLLYVTKSILLLIKLIPFSIVLPRNHTAIFHYNNTPS